MTTLNEGNWFSGPVKDAITLVSEKNCVFLVYIYDDSDKTTTFNATLNEEGVARVIREETVGLAMKKDSENAIMFGQFYPIQALPILYFIKQGTIRDFGLETITSQEIIDKINQLSNPTSSNQTSQVESIPPPQVDTISSPQTNDTSAEAKAAKKAEMQKQLEKVRKERAEREQKEAKEREMKRREEAKSMQEARQYQETRENKLYFDKIKKERKEDEEHRRRLREQIARDRAEKIAQRNAEKQRQSSSASTLQPSSSSQKSYDASNLNIRQLDGSNIRHQFEGSVTLLAVREWIKKNRTEDNKTPYKLSSQFPTRVFTETDDNKTLKDLNLCPSATIIMKPMKSGQITSNNAGVVGSIYNSIYALIASLFVMFNNFLTALFPTNGIANFDPQQQQQQQQKPDFKNLGEGQRLGGEGIGSSSSAPSSSNNIQRRNPYATRVNTLHDDSDDDNDKKRPTYNGNSVNHE